MTVQALHLILYVADPDAERNFFERFGFTTTYEGDEFPGFLALECGDVRFGVSQSKTLPPNGGHDGVRWQLIVDDVDQIAAICADASFPCEIVVETGGDTHRGADREGDVAERSRRVVRRTQRNRAASREPLGGPSKRDFAQKLASIVPGAALR